MNRRNRQRLWARITNREEYKRCCVKHSQYTCAVIGLVGCFVISLSLILTVAIGFRVGLFSMFMFGVAMCIGYVYADIILGFDPAPHAPIEPSL